MIFLRLRMFLPLPRPPYIISYPLSNVCLFHWLICLYSLKLKRPPTTKKFRDVLDELYAQASPEKAKL